MSQLQLITNIGEMRCMTRKYRTSGKTLGLVPTMGYLHKGHLSLIETAKKECDVIVLSIFVNPLQFGPEEDYEQYPRDMERDVQLAHDNGVDILFHPPVEEMYPSPAVTRVHVEKLSEVMCGTSRPGHFDGVSTVVSKLFHIIEPHKAYFGQKDAQQLAILKRMAEDLNIPVQVIGCPIVREADGLAFSSRNKYLTKEERAVAPRLYGSLRKGVELIESGERDPSRVQNEVMKALSAAGDFRIDYVVLYSYPNLTPLDAVEGMVILAAAVWLGRTRLIDNVIIDL